MDKSLDSGEFYAECEPPAIDYATALKQSYAQISPLPAKPMPDAANDLSDACEQAESHLTLVDDRLAIERWCPAEPQYCKAIADHYQVGKRSIQKWFAELLKLAPWLPESELRLSDDRYTPLAIELLGDRYIAGSTKKWAAVLAERFGDRPDAPAVPPAGSAAAQQPTEDEDDVTDVAWEEIATTPPDAPDANHSAIVINADYLADLEAQLAHLKQIEQSELATLDYRQSVVTSLVAHTDQFNQAIALTDELLLRQSRLEGVNLGVKCEQEKQEAYRATRYAVATGRIQVAPKSAAGKSDGGSTAAGA